MIFSKLPYILKMVVLTMIIFPFVICYQAIQATLDTQIIQELKSSKYNFKVSCSLIDQILVDQNFPSFDQDCEQVIIKNVSLVFKTPPNDFKGFNLTLNNTEFLIDNLTIFIESSFSEPLQIYYVDLNITFLKAITMQNSNLNKLRNTIIQSNSNYQDSNLTFSQVNLTSQKILIQSGYAKIDQHSYINSTEYFCKTSIFSCQLTFAKQDYYVYDDKNLTYLSFLQDYNETSQTFNISATLNRTNFTSLYDLLENNVFSDNSMRVQLLIFTYYGLTIADGSKIEASNISIYSQTVKILKQSSISTTGRGCSSSFGKGCGIYDSTLGIYQCGGSGGSYGGQGGNPSSLNYIEDISCNEIESQPIYGNPFNPIFEGSGGGCEDSFPPMSSGGGVVYMEGIMFIMLNQSSTIESNGTGTSEKDLNNGGGSGGSIQLHTEQLRGNSSNVIANGGFANESGGSGSGGRIKLNFTQWLNTTYWIDQTYDHNLYVQFDLNKQQYQNYNKITYNQVKVDPGISNSQLSKLAYNSQQKMLKAQKSSNSTGQPGSIMTTPCPQQFENVQGYKCQICQPGFYKSFSGWADCSPCRNAPKNSYYSSTNISLNSTQCSFICIEGYHKENGKCLNSSEYFIFKIGGWEVIIPVITFLLCLATLVLGRLLDNRKRKHSISDYKIQQALYNNNTSQHANMYDIQIFQLESQKRPDFHVEDLPYHMKRIYLHGENTHKRPFKLNPEDEDFEIEELAAIFNEMSKYTKLQTRLLWIFKLIYIVSYFWASRYMKTNKLIQLKKLIRDHQVMKKHYDRDEEKEQFKYKLSTSEDLTLAYIDIFNYNNSLLNWQNKTIFPVCLVLAGKGSFISPFHINVDDPLCKSLYFTFDQSQEQIDLNEESQGGIFRFEMFLKEFNSLAKLIDYSTREKTYLDNFTKLIKFVEKQNKRFFQDYGIETDICIHKLVRDKYVLPEDPSKMLSYNQINLQSRIIMLSYKDQGELINCLKDTHYLKNYSRFYEIKISLNFYIINKVIHNDQIEIKTEHNINKQIQIYIDYDQQDEEVNHLRIKVMKQNYSESKDRTKVFPRYEQLNDFYQNQNESLIEENRCLWLILIFFYLRRIFGVFKSSFLAYRQSQMSANLLGILMLITMILHFVSVICTFISFFLDSNDQDYRTTEMYIILLIYPFCFAISPLIMIVWVNILNYQFYIYQVIYQQISWLRVQKKQVRYLCSLIIMPSTLTLLLWYLDQQMLLDLKNQFMFIYQMNIILKYQILIGVAKIIGIVTTYLLSYFGSGYILLQELN